MTGTAGQQNVIQCPEHLIQDISEIKDTLKELSAATVLFQLEYTKEHQIVVSIAEQALVLSQQNQKDIKGINTSLAPLIQANKITARIGAVLGVSIITLIVMIITGQVQLIFP